MATNTIMMRAETRGVYRCVAGFHSLQELQPTPILPPEGADRAQPHKPIYCTIRAAASGLCHRPLVTAIVRYSPSGSGPGPPAGLTCVAQPVLGGGSFLVEAPQHLASTLEPAPALASGPDPPESLHWTVLQNLH